MWWDIQRLKSIDFRTLPILGALMTISILVISATTGEFLESGEDLFLTPLAKAQLRHFAVGWGVYLLLAAMDYRKLRSWVWVFYFIMVFMLVGLYFAPAIQNVHRWYRIPFLGMALQPSEYAKLIVVITLSWFLEHKGARMRQNFSTIQALIIVFIPFILILKQPDLGTALVLYPITLVMFYFGDIKKRVLFVMSALGIGALIFILCMFLGLLSHEKMRPYMTTVLKEYQYERLNPNTYHQKASQTAIALGGITGSGWKKSEFTGKEWLPEASTDSVFAAFAEEFGLVGVFLILLFFFGLIYFSFQVTAVAKDPFGRFLSAGIAVYLAMHVIVNMGMMCGFLPITGVPLILVSYGGSSVLSTMTALGILQSIYSRRFLF